jgi:hypothetical protein
MAAVMLSVLIVCLWLRTAYHEFQLLIGVTADTPMLQHLTYIGNMLCRIMRSRYLLFQY